MAVTEEFQGLDAYFKSTHGDKIILNDLSYFAVDDLELVNKSLMTVYNNADTISTIPSCDCGKYKKRYLLNRVCDSCGTKVKEPHEKVEPILWMKALSNGTKFLNPDFWLILSSIMDKKVDYLRWMCDPRYNPPIELPKWMYGVKSLLEDKRDYAHTMSKIPEIIDYLLTNAKFKEMRKQNDLIMLRDIYLNEYDILFSEYIPIINKKLFVMENTTKGRFINLMVSEVIDVVKGWLKFTYEPKQSQTKTGAITAITISKLAGLYYKYYSDYIVQKSGIFRKHIYGARSHFTFRSVISSIPHNHRYDQVFVPWGIGVTAFRPHVLNKLIKRGFSYKVANKLLYKTVKKYDPVIDEILNELISESVDSRGIPVIAQRNPSLLQGSAQQVFISKFKTAVYDNTISISQLVIKAPNGLLIFPTV